MLQSRWQGSCQSRPAQVESERRPGKRLAAEPSVAARSWIPTRCPSSSREAYFCIEETPHGARLGGLWLPFSLAGCAAQGLSWPPRTRRGLSGASDHRPCAQRPAEGSGGSSGRGGRAARGARAVAPASRWRRALGGCVRPLALSARRLPRPNVRGNRLCRLVLEVPGRLRFLFPVVQIPSAQPFDSELTHRVNTCVRATAARSRAVTVICEGLFIATMVMFSMN